MNTIIRASSLPELFDCPARWAEKHINGKRCPTSSNAQLGRAIHASTAVYDQSRIDGSGITADEAAGAAVDLLTKPDEEVDFEDEKPGDLANVAVSLHSEYCTTIAPKKDYLAVEVKCDSLTIADLGITLTGTTDRVESVNGGAAIADIKTGKSAVASDGTVSTKGHAYQIGVYELMAEAASGVAITEPAVIIGMNTAKTDKGQRIAEGKIEGARDVLLGDADSPGILSTASAMIKAGNFWGNPRSMLCHPKYCPVYQTCNYRK